jgi:hypothetical protein
MYVTTQILKYTTSSRSRAMKDILAVLRKSSDSTKLVVFLKKALNLVSAMGVLKTSMRPFIPLILRWGRVKKNGLRLEPRASKRRSENPLRYSKFSVAGGSLVGRPLTLS